MAVKTIQAVDNALLVLEQLSRDQPAGVTALARSSGLDKMAVQRVLVTLQDRDWARQLRPGGPWELTAKAQRLGDRALPSLRERARPHLETLAARSGETVLLFERVGGRLVVLDGVDSAHLIRMTVPIGTEVPLTRTGGLDAFLDADERASLPVGPLPVSARSIAATRRAGYFVIDGMYPHAVAVGSPLFDARSQVIGSVLVVGPRERLPRSSYVDIGGLVLAAAAAIGQSAPAAASTVAE
ncbi:MAG: IclR family transcriptional regulator [Acidimicrobiia bacterium]